MQGEAGGGILFQFLAVVLVAVFGGSVHHRGLQAEVHPEGIVIVALVKYRENREYHPAGGIFQRELILDNLPPNLNFLKKPKVGY